MPCVVTTARVKKDNTGAYEEIPVLLTSEGPLMPLLDYCLSKNRSLSWINKLIRAVGLFLDYLEANPTEPEEWRLFRNFAHALRTGTFNKETQFDPSWLCWSPGGSDVEYYIVLLSDFFDWLSTLPSGRPNQLNPKYTASAFDQKIAQKAYLYRRNKAFLGHAWDKNVKATALVRLTPPFIRPKIAKSSPPEFPDARFEELLFKGFRVRGRYDLRGMLITLLMHGAGFRVSEPFHLFITDVQPHWADDSTAFVAIHHPSLGAAPAGWMDSQGESNRGNRAAYLASKWAISPRNLLAGRCRAGWKSPMLDGKYYMQAWWFDPNYGKWFLQLWEHYRMQVAMIDRDNPFAFVNLVQEPKGSMYCLDSFLKAHRQAVERIGLVYGKKEGTTPHGHRHAYAQRLRRAGIGKLERQRYLHHCSPESQDVYVEPTTQETIDHLKIATANMRRSEWGLQIPEAIDLLRIDSQKGFNT